MRQYWLFAFILFSSFFVFTPARAQQSSGGKPISFSDTFQERYATQKVESVKTPRLNLKRILQEDADRGGSRFAAPLSVSYSLENSGVWTELEDGSLLWRLEITSEGALAIAAPYRVRRLTSFTDPWADPFNDGFQLTQALIAIGRGETFGVGLGGSVQKLFYLPEAHTDFILSVIGEEFGLVG